MNDYETTVILHPDLGETGTKDMVARIRSILETERAEIRKLEEWGIRELAYVIQKQRRGYYVFAEYRAEPTAVAELERQLRLADQALRYLTVRQIHKKSLPPRRPRKEEGSGLDEESAEETA